MSLDQKFEEFKAIIGDSLSIEDLSTITRESTLTALGADSLDVVEMVMSIEEKYDLKIPEEKGNELTKRDVGYFFDYIVKEKGYQ